MKIKKFYSLYPWQLLSRLFGLKLTCQLNLGFDIDVQRLQTEALNIIKDFNPVIQHGDDHSGGWKSVSLVSYGGSAFESKIVQGQEPLKTPALEHSPYMEQIIDAFDLPMIRVRMMQLMPGETILWHYDASESLQNGVARLHIPIITNSKVKMQISHESCKWSVGEIWYGDFSFPHRLHNASCEGRIHLVFDIEVTEKLLKMFPQRYIQNNLRMRLSQKIVARMINLYTWPRYRFGYMKRKQQNPF